MLRRRLGETTQVAMVHNESRRFINVNFSLLIQWNDDRLIGPPRPLI